MPESNITIAELHILARLHEWVTEGRKVKWAIEGDATRLMTGVLRHFVKEPERMGFLGQHDNVFDSYVRISAGMEWTLPVRDVIMLMDDNLFVVER